MIKKLLLFIIIVASCSTIMAQEELVGILKNSKMWTWKETSINGGGAVWGNAGDSGEMWSEDNISSAWWGCGTVDGSCSITFQDNLNHSSIGELTGEEYSGSTMVFGSDGKLTKYDQNGSLLNEGYYSISLIPDYNNARYGVLTTSVGAILWPYQINGGGYMPTEFDIAYITEESLILRYSPWGAGSWGECTWWSFGSDDGVEMDLDNRYSKKDGVSYYYDSENEGMVAYHFDNSVNELVFPETIDWEGKNIPVIGIDAMTFLDARNLTKITFPSTLKKIGTAAFKNTGITEIVIPEGVSEVGRDAFSNCLNLESFSFLSSDLEFDPFIIGYCPSLCEINVSIDNLKYLTIDGNLYTIDGSTLVCYAQAKKEFKIESTCTTLGQYSCIYSNAKNVILPENIKEIEYGSFMYSLIEELTFPSDQPRGCEEMFAYSQIKNLIIPDNWFSIPNLICDNATQLENLEYSNNITVIGEHAVSGCGKLNFEFKSNLLRIGAGFNYCGLKGKVIIPEGVSEIGFEENGYTDFSFHYNTGMTELVLPSTIQNTLKTYPNAWGNEDFNRIVNFSSYPVAIGIEGENVFQGKVFHGEYPYYLEYYCLPGIGIHFYYPWTENDHLDWTLDYCKDIITFEEIVIKNGICSFNLKSGSEEFNVLAVYFKNELQEPVNFSRDKEYQTYIIEGIEESDFCNIQVKIQYEDLEPQVGITLFSDGTAVADLISPNLDRESDIYFTIKSQNVLVSGAEAGQIVEIYTIGGKIVNNVITNGQPHQVIGQNLNPGIYIIKVGTHIGKLVIL